MASRTLLVLDVLRSIVLFFVAGVCEIGGGWLVWQSLREGKPWWYCLLGAVVLAGYGFVMTLQPEVVGDDFGRLDAAYGGVFIGMSFAWGRIFDDMQLRTGDLIGGLLCLAGVVVILAWPQGRAGASGGDTRCSSSTNSSVTGHGTGGTEWVGCANTSASVAGALEQSTV
jgi:drug/metabolite transporter superfamily protein YnfA